MDKRHDVIFNLEKWTGPKQLDEEGVRGMREEWGMVCTERCALFRCVKCPILDSRYVDYLEEMGWEG